MINNSTALSSVDSIVSALYEAVSGPAKLRDWKRLRSLFYPGARMIPTRTQPDGSARAQIFSVEEFIVAIEKNIQQEGFYERELSRQELRFGHMVHVLSAYECHTTPESVPFVRGVNSLSLLFDGTRYWILQVHWDTETPSDPLPTFA